MRSPKLEHTSVQAVDLGICAQAYWSKYDQIDWLGTTDMIAFRPGDISPVEIIASELGFLCVVRRGPVVPVDYANKNANPVPARPIQRLAVVATWK